jgi:hypothetical protein
MVLLLSSSTTFGAGQRRAKTREGRSFQQRFCGSEAAPSAKVSDYRIDEAWLLREKEVLGRHWNSPGGKAAECRMGRKATGASISVDAPVR